MNTQVTTEFNPHVAVINGAIKTTSLKIAEHFKKRHDNVLDKIQKLDCSPEFNAVNFKAVEYNDAKGEKRPAYEITRDGFTFLAMGFTGKEAAQWKEAYIMAFNRMESELSKNTCQLLPEPPKALPPKPIKTFYDLSYVKDLRHDDSQNSNVEWWSFGRDERVVSATDQDVSQGQQFLEETRKLALVKPQDAVQAITFSLMKIMGGTVPGVGYYAAELEFCKGLAIAAVNTFRLENSHV